MSYECGDEGDPKQHRKRERDAPKITDKTQEHQESRTRHQKKSRTRRRKESRTYTLPGELRRRVHALIEPAELRKKLHRHQQGEWATEVRIAGLLLLMDFILRNLKKGTLRVSSALAADYVSELCHPKNPHTIREPLKLLVTIGLLEVVRPASFGYVKEAATYAVPGNHLRQKKAISLPLTPKLRSKLQTAAQRKETRQNRQWRWRANLVRDIQALDLSDRGHRIATHLLQSDRMMAVTKKVLRVLRGEEPVEAWEDPYGTIRHGLSSCPRDLKPELLIGGEPVAICDISYAHHCHLPILLVNRIEYRGRKRLEIRAYQEELIELREFLSSGDYYEKWACDPMDRDAVKKQANVLLNMRTERARRIPLYRRMTLRFPNTFRGLEDIKKKDHRNAAKLLQRHTATAIERALLGLQEWEIPAIPDTDAIWCPAQHRQLACHLIGQSIFEQSRVRCKVGGRRYEPRHSKEDSSHQ